MIPKTSQYKVVALYKWSLTVVLGREAIGAQYVVKCIRGNEKETKLLNYESA